MVTCGGATMVTVGDRLLWHLAGHPDDDNDIITEWDDESEDEGEEE